MTRDAFFSSFALFGPFPVFLPSLPPSLPPSLLPSFPFLELLLPASLHPLLGQGLPVPPNLPLVLPGRHELHLAHAVHLKRREGGREGGVSTSVNSPLSLLFSSNPSLPPSLPPLPPSLPPSLPYLSLLNLSQLLLAHGIDLLGLGDLKEGGREGGREGGINMSCFLLGVTFPSLPPSLPPFLPPFLPRRARRLEYHISLFPTK